MNRYQHQRRRVRQLCAAAMIAALYVALTWLSAALGLDSRTPQCRFSEALCVLPLFCPAALPGVTVGCFVANLLFTPTPADLVFGTLATLLGAAGCYLIGRVWRRDRLGRTVVATLPNIAANTLILPLIQRYVYDIPEAMPYLVLTTLAGEMLSGGVLGVLLALTLPRSLKARWQKI